MSVVSNFSFDGQPVRVVDDEGQQWFVGKDVAERLGYADPAKAIRQNCKGRAKRLPLRTAGGTQNVRVLSEPDVLRLIVNSKLPAAERFERWVFEEVLPTIRRTGRWGNETLPHSAASAVESEDRLKLDLLATAARIHGEAGERHAFGVLFPNLVPPAGAAPVLAIAPPAIEPTLDGEAEGWACLAHLLALRSVSTPIRRHIADALEGKMPAFLNLQRNGIVVFAPSSPEGAGFTVWTRSRLLRHLFGGTRWYAYGWCEAMLLIPGVIARLDQNSKTNKSETRQTVFVPLAMLDDPRAGPAN